ncbi:hypothetical protein [Lysobacter sp. N42]|uniref:hypothetical protein n=1 Tax=Lysobacter sp. N42 TaxID=2545719 RepID=UPI00104B70D9|nr:hypothetical protein [Lysobacter sp. N42]TCZ82025.1 hypothetical protein EYQ95_23625 [Lysobacter sp. N42]
MTATMPQDEGERSGRAVRWMLGAAGLAAVFVAGLLLVDRTAPPGVREGSVAAERSSPGAAAEPARSRGTSRTGRTGEQADAAASREDAVRAAAEERHLRGLLHEPDPRRRLVAMYLLAAKAPDVATRRRMRAAIARLREEAPEDALIAQAQEWLCGDRRDPCSDADRGAWMALEPGNAASHLGPLRAAEGDPARQDAALRRMAQAGHYESHAHALALETVAAFDDYQPPPPGPVEQRFLRGLGLGEGPVTRRQVAAANHAWAMPMPSLSGISRACRPPLPTARARDCRTVLRRMASATTSIERMVALSGLERLSRGTPEHAYWAAASRRQRWQGQQFASIITDAGYWADFLRYGEVEAIQRGLVRAGRPLDPPPGWRAAGG